MQDNRLDNPNCVKWHKWNTKNDLRVVMYLYVGGLPKDTKLELRDEGAMHMGELWGKAL